MRTFIRYLKGYVRIRIEGYSPERFLNLCSYHNIDIRGLSPCDKGYEMYISAGDFKKLKPLVKKTHTKIRVCKKCGFPFYMLKNKRRKIFFAGAVLFVILLNIYSLFIWDIHFEGNVRRTDETLAGFLSEDGIKPGMLKKTVDCEGIVKNIRKEYNDIVWASASIEGSRLKIQIKENTDTYSEETVDTSEIDKATDLVAIKDGIITEMVTRAGIPQVHIGDSVKKGDILVLGREEILSDSQEVTGYQYHHSDADIYADTTMDYLETLPLKYIENDYTGHAKYEFYVRNRDFAVSVGSVKNSYQHSDIFTSEVRIKIGENFYFPFSLGIRTVREYTLLEKTYTDEEVRRILSERFRRFCEELEEKGIQILQNNVKIQLNEKRAVSSGSLILNEPIAGETDTEILTIERKETDESVGTDD